MEHLAHRCGTVAAAALGVGGLVAVLTSMTPAMPDVQIRDIDLAAANVDVSPGLDVIENHVRPDFVGNGGADAQEINLGSLLFGSGDDAFGIGSTFNAGEVDETVLNELTGGSFDPQNLPIGVPFTPDLSGLEIPGAGAFSGGTSQAANIAAADAAAGFSLMLQAIPDAREAMNAAIVAMQADFNNALVEAQQAAAERLAGDNPELNDVVNWIFSLNNTVLAQNEAAFNNMLGISFDTHDSLLGHFDPAILDTDWTTMLGFSPDAFNDIVNMIQGDNLALLLDGIDWDGFFAGLF
ncbi:MULTISPECIES: hypothetical protein [unclassified Mycobacterium]|uniref:hypothetical protein n=1 Tax=unclassified Mycobacterium TaxID=2642494 RepID=UPI0038762FD1